MSNRKLYRPSWAAYISLFLHALWIVIFVFILWVGPSGRKIDTPMGEFTIPYCQPCDQASDSIKVALEMGRLDLVSLALTILGVTLGLGAFGSFFIIKASAMHAAREEVREMAEKLIPELVNSKAIGAALQANPQVVASAMSSIKSAIHMDVDAESANETAEDPGWDQNV